LTTPYTSPEYVTSAGAAPLLGVTRGRSQKLLTAPEIPEGQPVGRGYLVGPGVLVPRPEPDAWLWGTGSDRRTPLWTVETIEEYKAARDAAMGGAQ
jgi:hypothetical protein